MNNTPDSVGTSSFSLSVPPPSVTVETNHDSSGGALLKPREEEGGSGHGGSTNVLLPAAGTFWQDPTAPVSVSPTVLTGTGDCGSAGLLSTGKSSKSSRLLTVAYVVNTELSSQTYTTENMALQCLTAACDIVGCKLEIVHFGKLDFGETSVLDQFYNAGKREATDAAVAWWHWH